MTPRIKTTLALTAAATMFAFSMPSAASVRSATVLEPVWLTKPDSAVIEHYYPIKAKLAVRNGKATMRCGVTASGKVEDCRILSETPKPYGFGASLLSMSRFFQMKTVDAKGNSVAGMDVTIQLSFYVK